MKQRLQELVLAIVFGLGIPGLILAVAAGRGESATVPDTRPQSQEQAREETVTIKLLLEEEPQTLPLETYLVGVLLRELPGDFHIEAMKAQATAARSYTLRTVARAQKHPEGVICADPACCQAYLSPQAYLDGGGSREVLAKVTQAVEETKGQVLCYRGEIIDATYFAGSGGHTEDALAVWGADVPYLQAVQSPGEEGTAHYTDTVQLSSRAFYKALGLDLTGTVAAWLGETTYTRGGGVDTMTIGGKIFTGTQLRTALGLYSTAFTLTAVGDTVTITTRGFGHRVGMSQQGAQAMALSGSDYRQILTHYYTDVQITTLGS